MSVRRLSEDECIAAREALTLPLLSEVSPFELAADESTYGPEDWAWLFLSLNQEYRDAYEKHANDAEVNISSKLAEPQISGLKPDVDGECATRFGLSAWVPPATLKLPRLAQKDDSWFFPVKRPVAEDYQRKEVSKEYYKRPLAPLAPGRKEHTYIPANEDLFGYRPPLRIPHLPDDPNDSKHRTRDVSTWTNIWVAIDCSVPPAGQVAALYQLTEATRSKLQAEDWATHDGSWDVGTEDVARSDAFAHMNFLYAEGTTNEVTDIRALWRAVVIDPLGAIVKQKEILLPRLQAIHDDLVARGRSKKALYQRFPNTLPQKQDNDDTYRNGGSYLKALFTLAELCDRGCTDAQEIAQIVGVHSTTNRYPYSWMRDFHQNIEDYIDEALQMIRCDYRLLIHAQRPEI